MAKGATNTSPMAVIIVFGGIYLWPILVGIGLVLLVEKIRVEFIVIGLPLTIGLGTWILFTNMSMYTSVGVVATLLGVVGYFIYLYNTNIDRITEEVQSK